MVTAVIPLLIVVPVFLIVQEARELAGHAYLRRRVRRAARRRMILEAVIAAVGVLAMIRIL